MNIKYQIILENENKIYKIDGKDAVFNTYKEAVENYKKIKTSEPLIIREISKNKIRDLNQTAYYDKETGKILNYENSILSEENINEDKIQEDKIQEDKIQEDKIYKDITDEIINNEWNNYENDKNKNQEIIGEPIRGFIIKNEIFKDNIFKILNYIQSELINLKKENLELDNKLFFNCRKEILIKLSDKLIIEIQKLQKIKEQINLTSYSR